MLQIKIMELKDTVETKSIQGSKVTRYINGEFPRGRNLYRRMSLHVNVQIRMKYRHI